MSIQEAGEAKSLSLQRQMKSSVDREGMFRSASAWKSTESIRLQSLRHMGKGSSFDLSKPCSLDLDESEETVASKRRQFAAMGVSNRQRNRQDMGDSDDIMNYFAGTGDEDFDGEMNATHQLNELERMLDGSGPIKLLRRIVVASMLVTGILVSTYTLLVSRGFDIETPPGTCTGVVIVLFAITILLLLRYNTLVEERQELVLRRAINSTAIVSSLFPEGVHDRLLETTSMGFPAIAESDDDNSASTEEYRKEPKSPKPLLMKLLRDTTGSVGPTEPKIGAVIDSKPIADFFPNCTVMFSDIVGFTAWSSARQPTDVFTLLESIYKEFDKTARKRRVFKVETIGDCYVAVTGLPEVQEDHAILMAGFALECHKLMRDVCRKLETTLGPDTGNLCMRTGLHSGPVTAGVLRGEKSRFQLFGDTVNTAARMESNGERNRIHVSQKTADLLFEAGKGDWLTARPDKVNCKGKGMMQTYWFGAKPTKQQSAPMSVAMAFHEFTGIEPALDTDARLESDKNSLHTRMRLNQQESMIWGGNGKYGSIDNVSPTTSVRNDSAAMVRLMVWNCNVLLRLTQQIVADRGVTPIPRLSNCESVHSNEACSLTMLEEVKEVISFPANLQKATYPNTVVLDEKVEKQVRDFVRSISASYRPNPFHNYEHACHVQMSMLKLIERITAAERAESETGSQEGRNCSFHLLSDPLVQFALIFSGLIHDVDHTGVPNSQLVKEKAAIALAYDGKSVAEQNAFDLAWTAFMDPNYSDFRSSICRDSGELARFRQLVVNIVAASDILDDGLRETQTKSWYLAFDSTGQAPSQPDMVDRRATVVLNDLMQASDIAHTMQDYDVYVKWNKRLFQEMMASFKSGRAESDPAESWYQDQLRFFDDYVIPLAERLKGCGIFGLASDECLQFALENRARWELEGGLHVAQKGVEPAE